MSLEPISYSGSENVPSWRYLKQGQDSTDVTCLRDDRAVDDVVRPLARIAFFDK